MRALVVGGTGFLGVNLVDELLRRGVRVRVTRRRRSPTLLLRGRAVEFAPASLEEPEALEAAMAGCDVVFLAAGHYPRDGSDLERAVDVGVAGVRNACTAALRAGVKKLVYTSSVGALSRAPAGHVADERDVPAERPAGSAYRAAKWAMEREVERFAARGLAVATVLPGGCVGPWDARAGTSGLLLGVMQGALPFWVEGTVNLVDVADVARAHAEAAVEGREGRYCVAGHDVRVGELLPWLAARYGGRAPAMRLEIEQARARADADEARAKRGGPRAPVSREWVDLVESGQSVSSARAERELGVRFGPIAEAFDRAREWYARFGYCGAQGGAERGV